MEYIMLFSIVSTFVTGFAYTRFEEGSENKKIAKYAMYASFVFAFIFSLVVVAS